MSKQNNHSISELELIIIKDILIGKSSEVIKNLLIISENKVYQKILEGHNFKISHKNWTILESEISLLYSYHLKQNELTDLERKVMKRNAKLGFPIKRKKLFPKTSSKFSPRAAKNLKNQITEQKRFKKKVKKIEFKLTKRSPLLNFIGKRLSKMTKILGIPNKTLINYGRKYGCKFEGSDYLTLEHFEILLPLLLKYKYKGRRGRSFKSKKLKLKKTKIESARKMKILKGNVKGKKNSKFDNKKRKRNIQRNAISTKGYQGISTPMRD